MEILNQNNKLNRQDSALTCCNYVSIYCIVIQPATIQWPGRTSGNHQRQEAQSSRREGILQATHLDFSFVPKLRPQSSHRRSPLKLLHRKLQPTNIKFHKFLPLANWPIMYLKDLLKQNNRKSYHYRCSKAINLSL